MDKAHFAQARAGGARALRIRPTLPRPRLGYYGVVDERVDTELLAAVADAHPEWSVVVVGPVVKIAPEDLPQRANLHYLGGKDYKELPAYLAGWDVALSPFAVNDATRFISPTKTPEYLSGGRPVVSTAIRDVARQWGDSPGVIVARDRAGFIAGCEKALDVVAGAALVAAPGRRLPGRPVVGPDAKRHVRAGPRRTACAREDGSLGPRGRPAHALR